MLELSSLKFTLRDARGQQQELSVDSDLARVGSGAHCEIRLPPEAAATEQLRIEVRAGVVFAEARSLSPPTWLNGAPFTQGRLLPDSVLQLGAYELCVAVVASAQSGRPAQTREASRSKAIYALGALGFPLGFWYLLTTEARGSEEPARVEPPALFASEPAACSESATGPAAALAERELIHAESARERAPFEAAEGVNAVALFERAAACFRAAGQAHDAEQAQLSAEAGKRKLNQEFRLHQVRLDWARATAHAEEARTEVRFLLSLLGQRGGEYTAWLAALDRRMQLTQSGKKD